MKNLKSKIYQLQPLVYKIACILIAIGIMVYFFPKKGKFKYEFDKEKPWQYDNLYAPFDFAVLKPTKDIAAEKEAIISNSIPYFNYSQDKANKVASKVSEYIRNNKHELDHSQKIAEQSIGFLNAIYEKGVVDSQNTSINTKQFVYLTKDGDSFEEEYYENFVELNAVPAYIDTYFKDSDPYVKEQLTYIFYKFITPNVFLNKELTQKSINEELSKVLSTRGSVTKGSRVVAKGQVVNAEIYQKLKSIQEKYETQIWSINDQYWIVFGYIILTGLALSFLCLFLYKFHLDIFENNTKITFIIFNIVGMVVLTTMVVKYDPEYIYIIPLCILPLLVRAFFEIQLGFVTLMTTALINAIIVPDSFEYLFLQLMAGMVTILSVSELYKRANLYITVGQITGVYILSYLAFTIISEGTFSGDDRLQDLIFFVLCGLATLIVHPLIYGFEKIFGLVSDVSLLELSDTNSKLLKELSEKAPGTFHHSLNVANIAEAAANEIGANAMLVRVGALYHDIGKMKNPTFFTENQKNGMNPHDQLSPQESARVIIGHTLNGIEIAKKNKLPDRLIDFIRTHHGTSLVYYFYVKAKEQDDSVSPEQFRYPGPTPYSKETAILMMSDSIEAASRSIKNPNSVLINEFVEKIIDKQMDEGQFLNANITLKEISQIKKVMKKKLNNIYHLRIEYPE